MDTPEAVSNVIDQGFRALEEGDLVAARAAGVTLERHGHSAAFELLAVADAEDGELERAIATLERGVGQAPEAWLLWQLLGNYRSNAEDLDGALAAYAKAKACPDADAAAVTYNHATALMRNGMHANALGVLDTVEDDGSDPDLTLLVAVARMGALNQLERFPEAAEVGARALSVLAEDADPDLVAPAHAELGAAILGRDGNRELAAEYARTALAQSKHCASAMWLLREVEGRSSPTAKHFGLVLRGDWDETQDGVELSFCTNYNVVADDVEEAFALAAALEPEALRASLALEHSEVLDDPADAVTGVYDTGGYALFPRDGAAPSEE